ncbi:MAG TPA: arginase [Planctomycetes bacterium]|nr:arginase [Planctomycetota bacterium]
MTKPKRHWGEIQARRVRERVGRLRFFGVPMDLGQDRRGVDMGPSAVRAAGLATKLQPLGLEIQDEGDVLVPSPEAREMGSHKAKFLAEIAEVCEELSLRVEASLDAGERPIVVGGDHSIAIGTVAGVSAHFKKRGQSIGLLWVDAHADMNTPDSSPSGNVHGMPLACCLGIGPEELTTIGGFEPKVDRDHVVLLGIRNLDDVERELVKKSGVHAFTMRDLDVRGMADVMEEALSLLCDGTAGFHVSFDVDGLDPSIAPGVGTPVRGGLTFREAHLLMEMISDSNKALSFEMTEINPILDQRNATAEVAVDLLLSGLGKRIL